MAKLEVIRDPNLEQSPIMVNFQSPGESEEPEQASESGTEIQQTKVFGVLQPLIALNGIVVGFNDIMAFNLDYTGTIPRIQFGFMDRNNMFKNLTLPGNDCEFRVQILPPADNTYKKIDLTFMCNDLHIQNGIVYGSGEYKLADFTQSRFKALGQISTYELFDLISNETGMGFATNTEATEDARYMQCQYESYKDVIDREMPKSGSSQEHVFDWWVDVWNHLILCDLYDRINSVDEEEDMQIWMTANDESAAMGDEEESIQTLALFTNHPVRENTDLYVEDYDVQTAPASQTRGNGVTLSVYEENKKEYIDHYIADGDIEKNVFERFEYAGEVYGDYNYLVAEKAREIYLRKVKSEVIVIHVRKPQLGINRGDQLRFIWYDNDANDAIINDALEDVGAKQSAKSLGSEIGWLKDWDPSAGSSVDPMRVNLQLSGQYTCVGQYIRYDANIQRWDAWLYLSRPASKRPKILTEDLTENKESNNGN